MLNIVKRRDEKMRLMMKVDRTWVVYGRRIVREIDIHCGEYGG